MTTISDLLPYIAAALAVGGVAAALSRRRDLIQRWCAWAVGVPIVVGALSLGAPGAAVLVAGVAVVCVAEYGRLVELPRIDQAAIGVAVVGTAFAAWLAPAYLPQVVIAGILVVALVPVLAGDAAAGLRRLSFGVLGVIWLSPLAMVVLLGPTALALFIAVSLNDIGAYFGGRLLGGPRLSPLSPAKRWSGVLVGATVGLGVLAVLGAFTPATAVAVAVGAPLGDLIESMIKRGVAAKDTASWLPGSGGLLDRVDSLLLALAITALLA